jgi:hypothetical protein
LSNLIAPASIWHLCRCKNRVSQNYFVAKAKVYLNFDWLVFLTADGGPSISGTRPLRSDSPTSRIWSGIADRSVAFTGGTGVTGVTGVTGGTGLISTIGMPKSGSTPNTVTVAPPEPAAASFFCFGQQPLLPLLLLGLPFFPIIPFGSTTLLTGMIGISLHMQWPLTSQSHGSVS